jgi:hypothetical protein
MGAEMDSFRVLVNISSAPITLKPGSALMRHDVVLNENDVAFFVGPQLQYFGSSAYSGAKERVVAMDTGGTLNVYDSKATVTVNSSSAQTINLPTINAEDVGIEFTIVKLGSGQVTIQAPSGVYIDDSSSGGTLYNGSSETYATVTIRAVTNSKWVVIGMRGTWATS